MFTGHHNKPVARCDTDSPHKHFPTKHVHQSPSFPLQNGRPWCATPRNRKALNAYTQQATNPVLVLSVCPGPLLRNQEPRRDV
jgi:hypothetical protein